MTKWFHLLWKNEISCHVCYQHPIKCGPNNFPSIPNKNATLFNVDATSIAQLHWWRISRMLHSCRCHYWKLLQFYWEYSKNIAFVWSIKDLANPKNIWYDNILVPKYTDLTERYQKQTLKWLCTVYEKSNILLWLNIKSTVLYDTFSYRIV